MRLPLSLALVLVGGAAGCGSHGGPRAATDGTLILEVGGDRSSLRAALAAAGIESTAGSRPGQADRDDVPVPEQDTPDEGGEVRPLEPAPEVAGQLVVSLGKGETLMLLAKRHLGSSQRYREILTRNGWTEDDARRLREGQLVKIPLDRRADAPR